MNRWFQNLGTILDHEPQQAGLEHNIYNKYMELDGYTSSDRTIRTDRNCARLVNENMPKQSCEKSGGFYVHWGGCEFNAQQTRLQSEFNAQQTRLQSDFNAQLNRHISNWGRIRLKICIKRVNLHRKINSPAKLDHWAIMTSDKNEVETGIWWSSLAELPEQSPPSQNFRKSCRSRAHKAKISWRVSGAEPAKPKF